MQLTAFVVSVLASTTTMVSARSAPMPRDASDCKTFKLSNPNVIIDATGTRNIVSPQSFNISKAEEVTGGCKLVAQFKNATTILDGGNTLIEAFRTDPDQGRISQGTLKVAVSPQVVEFGNFNCNDMTQVDIILEATASNKVMFNAVGTEGIFLQRGDCSGPVKDSDL